ncbi:HNH endonuclease [Chromatium okenii]|uniref:RNA-guided endonuclease IscB n=1 Tax=Chromatium okenii TaxID=61644 RepID=UPI001908E8AF|nr:RNA-guided endonuclease IscB [Chromatium okenii]MBK1641468.1 HNH endonuclease [Chromatium okenii]
MAVFVLDKRQQPLMPCSEKKARLLLSRGRAVVARLVPFTIRLKDRVGGAVQPVRIKLDPGSKTTGLALVRETEAIDPETGNTTRRAAVLWLGELTHRGQQISEALTARRQMRRRRRSANLRHREPRFHNRTKPVGWLAPSLRHRVETTQNWVKRLRDLAPVTAISLELVRFDMQQMQNPEISGVEYQRGTLAGYEVREYLLEKWQRQCVYCGAKNVPLQIEHIQPRASGGSNRISNLALACASCNQKKGSQPIAEFLNKKPEVLRRIQAQAKKPLRDAAAVNSTRWALFNALNAIGVPVETGSGGLTQFNRSRLNIPKTHALDAACVGKIDTLTGWQCPILAIKATGRGLYQRAQLDCFGFPRSHRTRRKRIYGFQTGDRVIARVLKGKNAGVHIGRVAIRATGRFNLQTAERLIQSISHRCCTVIQRADGYSYTHQKTLRR